MNKNELLQFLSDGEGYRIEFKEAITGLEKEFCAFANASGGWLFIGVNDNGQIIGEKITNKLKSQVQDIADNCDPAVKILLHPIDNVLAVEVREGTDKPYRCKTGFYNRIGPNSQKLSRNEIISFIQHEGRVRFDEMVSDSFREEDLDKKKLDSFLTQANISRVLDDKYILKNLGIADIQGGETIFLNCAPLFFAKKLSDFYFHTVVTCALYKGNEKVTVLDRKDFNEDLVSNIDNAMVFLKQHLQVRYEFDGQPARKEIPEIPFDALREAVVNAVVHRNYFEKGANVMIEIFDNRVDISSPGSLPKGLEIVDFGKKSVLRNPNIANLLHRIDYIEKMGTGVQRIQNRMKEAGLPKVEYQFTGFVTATFQRVQVSKVGEKVGDRVGDRVGENLTQNQQNVLNELKKNSHLSAVELSQILGISSRKIEENIAKLKNKGLIKRIGSPKGGHWDVLT